MQRIDRYWSATHALAQVTIYKAKDKAKLIIGIQAIGQIEKQEGPHRKAKPSFLYIASRFILHDP